MKMTRLLSCLATIALFLMPATLEAQTQVLSPGDAVRIAVWRNPELSADTVRVGADGTLKHPLYQGIQVAGIPMTTVRTRIQEFLSRYTQNPQFTIDPLFRVTVGGEVRQPRLMALPEETTLLQALALAGGPTERGRMDQVTLVRGGQPRVVDFTNASDPLANAPIQSGDQLVVPRRRDTFRDYVVPSAGIIGALAAVANLILR